MFGVGFGEIVVVCLVALFFMGADDFVKLAKLAARGLREFRVLKRDIKDSLENSLKEPPRKKNGEPGGGDGLKENPDEKDGER